MGGLVLTYSCGPNDPLLTIVVDYDERQARNERYTIAGQNVPLLKVTKLVRVVVAEENQHHIESHAEHLLKI
jgi:hypothetical protein